MKEGSFFERFYTVGDWLFKLIALQLLFLLSVVITLSVFGLFPGLAAGFATCRQWLMEKNNPLIKTYMNYFKSYFGQANVLGYILLVCSVSIGLYIYWFQQLTAAVTAVSPTILCTLWHRIIFKRGLLHQVLKGDPFVFENSSYLFIKTNFIFNFKIRFLKILNRSMII